MTVYLVRHGRPIVDPDRDAFEWELDPAAYDDIWALRASGRLPSDAAWFTSPERKAVATAQLLTDQHVAVVDALCEHVRRGWQDDFHALVEWAFLEPDRAVHDGWEPLATCRTRVVTAVRGILGAHSEDDVVLVGHGTAWTLAVADLTDEPPELDRWRAMTFPDVIVIG